MKPALGPLRAFAIELQNPVLAAEYPFMEPAGPAIASIRHTRAETRRVVWALIASLLLHFLGWGVYELGKRQNWWEWAHWPHWMQKVAQKIQAPPPPPRKVEEQPLSFLDVSQPSDEAPEKAKYYSDKNSRAANARMKQEAEDPNIEGHQTEVPKTEDITHPVIAKNRAVPEPTQKPQSTPQTPTPPAPPTTTADKETTAASPEAGDLTQGKPSPTPLPPATTPHKPARPRTLKQAQAQLARRTPGQAVLINGGVHRVALTSSLDARATPTGAYDSALVDAISQQWWNLLEDAKFAEDRKGRVTIHFRLHVDGSVTEIKMPDDENDVGQLLGFICINAITKAGPFAPWPEDMRKEIGENFRDVTFTFHYY